MGKFNISNVFIDDHEFYQTPAGIPNRWILIIPPEYDSDEGLNSDEYYMVNSHNQKGGE